MHHPVPQVTGPDNPREALRQFLGVFRYSGRALRLVWSTSAPLTVALVILSLVAGLAPAAAAYIGKHIVDAVVVAARDGGETARMDALFYVALEAGALVLLSAAQRGISLCRSLLRAQLGHRVNLLVLEKALTLDLAHFEDSELYDKMTRSWRDASSRPLSLVMRTFGLVQDGVSLVTYGALLLQFSPLTAIILVVAALPSFVAETRFSGEAFRLFRWRTPETREQVYLKTVLGREDYAKEVKAFNLGPRLLERYEQIFCRLYREDRNLTIRRDVWGFILGLLSTFAFYGLYAWIAIEAMYGSITLGEMTMYVLVFKQGQSAMASSLAAIGGMYEDNLYLSNLYEFLEEPVEPSRGTVTEGKAPGDGLRFDAVCFTYPGAEAAAVADVSFHLPPGRKLALVGENGSGKTTLIKLLARLYTPTTGRILLDGLDIQDWDLATLRRRMGIIFQDFVRYQLTVGENIGVGDEGAMDDEQRWREAAQKGMAAPFIDELPEGYQTQLGRWFRAGRELSLGQWQKVALSRAFMGKQADILVLDEPTASMDAAAEVEIFSRFRTMTPDQMAVLISHRFSTVRMADRIVVLSGGRVIEEGTHDQLIERDGHYARLFSLQAAGYR